MTKHEKPYHDLIVCDCESVDHHLVISRWNWDDIDDRYELTVAARLNSDLPFWQRLKIAFGYVFNRKAADYTEVVISSDRAQKMRNILDKFISDKDPQ